MAKKAKAKAEVEEEVVEEEVTEEAEAEEVAEAPKAKKEKVGASGEVTVSWGPNTRVYSQAVHGDNFVELAQEQAQKRRDMGFEGVTVA